MNHTAILLWSMPEEPGFVDFLEKTAGAYRVFPLRYPAMRAARRLFPSERIGDVSKLISPSEREDLERVGMEQYNSFMSMLEGASSSEPWLVGINLEEVPWYFLLLNFWEAVLDRLRVQEGFGRIEVTGFFSRGSVSGFLLRLSRILDLLTDPDAGSLSWTDAFCHSAGRIVNRFPSWFSYKLEHLPQQAIPTRILIGGLIESDRRAQMGLIAGLNQKGIPFRWLLTEGTHLPVSLDEKAGGGDEEPSADVVPFIFWGHWKRAFFGRASNEDAARKLENILRRQWKALPRVRIAREFARLIVCSNPHLRLQYVAMEHVVARYQPQWLVVNSATDTMHVLSLCARRHRVRVFRFPHGHEFHFRNHAYCEATRMGLMGRTSVRAWEEAGHDVSLSFLCGAMHVGQQALSAIQRVAKMGMTREQGRVCLLVSPSFIFYPDFNWEMEKDFNELSESLSSAGLNLWVRRHPRQNTWDGHDFELMQRDSGAWQLSDSQQSLADELARSEMAIVRKWSDAAIVALYAEIPLLGWLPRSGYPESSRLIRELPLFCDSLDAMGQTALRLQKDPGFRQDVIQRQREYLEQIIDQPWADPYARAVDELQKLVD